MVVIDIPPNHNCEPVELRVFNDVEPPRPATQVRLEREPGQAAWYDVVGWTATAAPCPALVQKVEDSGEGVACLVYGGDAGLRLRPEDAKMPWGVEVSEQWGEPFIIAAGADDVR